jgi:hypothetical protein
MDGAGHAARTATTAAEFRAGDVDHLDALPKLGIGHGLIVAPGSRSAIGQPPRIGGGKLRSADRRATGAEQLTGVARHHQHGARRVVREMTRDAARDDDRRRAVAA